MIDTPARSAIAAAIATLVRTPGSTSKMDVRGAAVIIVDGPYVMDAALAAEQIARALNYRIGVWNEQTTTAMHAVDRWKSTMKSARDGGDQAMLVTTAAVVADSAAHAALARLAIDTTGGHAIVVIAERGAGNDDFIEAICDVVTECEGAGSGRDGGVEVVEL